MINFKTEVAEFQHELIACRRDLHQHPELAFQEVRTAGLVAAQLQTLGLEVRTGVAQTGVVAILEGSSAGPTVMYRADMDALPIHEENEVVYKSLYPGKMHACGHDGHVAIALTVAKIMARHRDQIAGRIKFVFQPGEEGAGGALAMIKAGVLDDPEPDFALGLHLWQELPFGTVGTAEGAIMSGSSTFQVRIKGRGGHAAMPHTTVDPVLCSAQLITALHTIVTRRINAMAGAVVLSVTGVNTSTYKHNILPEYVEVVGTFRTFNAYTSELIEQHIRDVSRAVCESMDCSAQVQVKHLTIPVVNHPDVVKKVREVLCRFINDDALDNTARTMASEDMSYLLEDVPGMFLLIGTANPAKGFTYGHHHPRFDIDEAALPFAARLMCETLASYVLPDYF
jgi:amidohydrolase